LQDVKTIARVVGQYAQEALIFKDNTKLQNIINKLKIQQEIIYAGIYDDNGELRAYLLRETDTVAPLPVVSYTHHDRLTEHYLEMTHPITLNQKIIGWVYLRFDLQTLNTRIAQLFYFIILLFIGLLISSFLFYWQFQRSGSQAVIHLSQLMEQIGNENNYTLRAQTHKTLTPLIERFNQMLTQIQAHHEMLKANQESAQASNQAKSNFLTAVSHKIRTPMNGVLGMTELLLDTELTEQQQQLAETVRNSGKSVLTIINDILDFSQIEAGTLTLNEVEVNLVDLVEEVVESFAHLAHHKKLELMSFLPHDLPAQIQVDPVRLRQLLTHLISNAIEFTEKGEIVVRAFPVQKQPQTLLIRFEVEDTGVGMTPETLKQLFQPFQHTEDTLYRGSGLSLTISQKLAQMMGGDIGVHSQYGQGATFWFTLKLAQLPKQPAIELSCKEYQDNRFLIVDDNLTFCEVLRHNLHGWGLHQVNSAHTAQHALEKLKQAVLYDQPYDIVFVNAQLPDKNCFELARTIKTTPMLVNIQLVLLITTSQQAEMGIQPMGIAVTLTKPIRQMQLYDCINALLTHTHLPHTTQLEILSPTQFNARVLLAEDNLVNQKVARLMLMKLGCQVDIANNGLEVIKALSEHHYDLILMDCQMPEMDGFAVTRIIRAQEYVTTSTKVTHTPIVALTAHALEGDREHCLNAGMDDYLGKPFDKEQLYHMLAKWLSNQCSVQLNS
ncbi:MAG: response regulator, partial [Pseudomonadota bacterium]|nr:response regulator [Pseudomonadota bacterium]